MNRFKTTITMLLFLVCTTAAHASAPYMVGSLKLPGDVHAVSAAYDTSTQLLLIGARQSTTRAELYALAFDPSGRTPSVTWTLDIPGKVNAIATDGTYAYLATSWQQAELVIVRLSTGVVAGTFDANGPADAVSLQLMGPGALLMERRRSNKPETYVLEVSDPAAVMMLETIEGPGSTVSWPPFGHYAYPGRLVAEAVRTTDRGTVYYGVTYGAAADLYVVEATRPTVFGDVNGDGIYRLGCVGDSNTSPFQSPSVVRWCEALRARFADSTFEIVNVAVSGATVVAPNLYPSVDSTAYMQMDLVLTKGVDAVVLAFGTNDFFQGRSPAMIVDAYLDQAEAARVAGVEFFVATTPPTTGCFTRGCPNILATNDALHATFDAAHVVEFYDGFTAEHIKSDNIHLNDAGQTLRMERAFSVLANRSVYDAQ